MTTVKIALRHDDTITKPKIPEDFFSKAHQMSNNGCRIYIQLQKMYKQTDRVAMGSPLRLVLANIFMGYCEEKISKEYMPLFYNRYVDDTFAIFRLSHELCS